MRPLLRWVLLASMLLSAVALLWPDGVDQPVRLGTVEVANTQREVLEAAAPGTSKLPDGVVPARHEPLPERLPGMELEKAEFDPFAGAQPPPALAATPPQPIAGPAPVAQPIAPALDYRYLGAMTDPSGKEVIYLTRLAGAGDVAISVGTRLDEGYVVESITTDSIGLYYPPLDTRAVIAIPAARNLSSP